MGEYVYATAAVHVPAPPEQVFALVTDWPRHREWMSMTTARQTGADRVEAYTGIWPVGFLDELMTITAWEPPTLVRMRPSAGWCGARASSASRPARGVAG